MAVNYSTTTKTARMQAVITQIDAGGAAGKLEIGTAAMAIVLAAIALNYGPCGTVSGPVLTLSGFPKSVAAAAGGVAASARVRTSANADVITGLTVGTSGTDVVVDNTNIAPGQIVNVASASITHAA